MSRSKSILIALALLIPSIARSADFLGKSTAAWVRDLSAAKPEVRRSAAFALGRIGADAEGHLPKLVALLREDRDPGVREAAAAAVGDVIVALRGSGRGNWTATWPALREGLRDGAPKVKRSAAYAIGAFGPDAVEAVPALIAALRDPVPMVRQNAAWALGRIGSAAGEETVDLLCQRLSDDDPLVRRDSATALGDIGLPTAARAWKPLLELVRSEAVKRDGADDVLLRTALGKLAVLVDNQNKQVIDAVMPLLQANNTAAVRNKIHGPIQGILKNLGGIGLPDAKAAREAAIRRYRAGFDEAFQKQDVDLLLPGLTGLEEVGKEENKKLKTKLAPLVALLQNDDPETAMLASFALARVGGPLAIDAIPVLKRTLRDPDPKLQEQAATFLGEMGPDAADAAEALAEAIRPDRALAVRSRAAVALTKIGPDVVRVTPQLLETLRAKDATETSESPVRKYIAEVFVQMGYPNTRKAMPELLEVLADDTNMDVRHRCIWVFLSMEPRDFPEIRSKSGRTAEEVLTAALSDGDPEKTLMIRYTAARALAVNLGKKAPTKALDLLVDMLKNENLKIHLGAQSTVTSVGSEGTVGTTRSTDRQKGDARFLAAEALSFMGTTANRKDVVSALRKAATDTKDETGRLRTEAAKALKAIGVEP